MTMILLRSEPGYPDSGSQSSGRKLYDKGAKDENDQPDDDERSERTHRGDDNGAVTDQLLFMTRQGCHLCEDALRLLDGIPLEIIDIDDDPALLARYDQRVPVLLDPKTGMVLMEGEFEPGQVRQLRRALSIGPSLLSRWRR